jgi:hypothetical protein
MKVLGIDFTSSPNAGKPLTCLRCTFDEKVLRAGPLEKWPNFSKFEEDLRRPGPWIAGVDFPFGQSRKFIDTIGWPSNWNGYVRYAHSLGREGFRHELDRYRQGRPAGDKEHRRKTDVAAGSVSPQKLYGVPVGLMFFEGAPRLAQSGATIPHLQNGDPLRIVIEAYPGVLARSFIGRRSYKHDTKSKQTTERHEARCEMLKKLRSGAANDYCGFAVEAPDALCDDPAGDHLDALLCAIQAAWAWRNRARGFGLRPDVDPLEGWIADPSLARAAARKGRSLALCLRTGPTGKARCGSKPEIQRMARPVCKGFVEIGS